MHAPEPTPRSFHTIQARGKDILRHAQIRKEKERADGVSRSQRLAKIQSDAHFMKAEQ